MTFSDLNLIPPLLKAAEEAGYETPSPIQAEAIPPVLAGRDLLGCAQTGTGKTAAFAMPILQRLGGEHPARGARSIRALILTPTRELALQIDESFEAYGCHMTLRHCVVFGGVSQNPQVAALQRGVDILTATPGRLNDLVGQGYIHLEQVEVFVLDEADRMLDMGFVHDVKRVLTYLPKQKQTLLFSATMPPEIEQLADGLLHDPAKVMVTPPATTVETIRQSVYFVDKGNKRYLLAQLLRDPDVESALVFTRTKHGADRVVKELGRDGIEARAIHGNKSQNARQDALNSFKEGRIRVLVATDIAARGIDITGLSHVFNYDLSNIPETYVHRIGRTGRAGRDGIAISFCDFDEKEFLADIEKLTKLRIPVVQHDWPMQVFEKTEKLTQTRPAAQRSARRPAQEAPARAPRAPRKATGSAALKGEEKTMENSTQTETRAAQPAAQNPQTSDASGDQTARRRRRRGGRRHSKGGQSAAGQSEQAPAGEAGPAAVKSPAPAQAPGQNKKQRPANGPGGRFQQGGTGRRSGQTPDRDKPAQSVRTEKAAPAAVPEKDDSIQIISRRAPAQKFASFEDYMKAHGGASEPVEGDGSAE